MNKRIVLFAVSILWIAIAFGLINSRELILKQGTTVVLETVPVDPRDLVRGDYVRLSYKISRLDLNFIRSADNNYRRGEKVFVFLEPTGGVWQAVSVQKAKPQSEGLYIKGRVDSYYGKKLNVDYGIESYFVPEGEGREIEKTMRGAKSLVKMEVSIAPSGQAVIKRLYN